MRAHIVGSVVAAAVIGLGGSLAWAGHSSAAKQHSQACLPVKQVLSADLHAVTVASKAYYAAAARYGAGSVQAAGAATRRDQDDLLVQRQVVAHPTCWPSGDVADARRHVVLLEAQVANDETRTPSG